MDIGSTGNLKKGTILEFCHSKGMAGHMGIEKTKSRILEILQNSTLVSRNERSPSTMSAAWRGQKGCGNEGFYGGL